MPTLGDVALMEQVHGSRQASVNSRRTAGVLIEMGIAELVQVTPWARKASPLREESSLFEAPSLQDVLEALPD